MSSEDGRIMLLSCEDREDVVDFWFFAQRAFWPDCPWPVDVLDESTVNCWARRLLTYLESVEEDWLLFWVDDGVLAGPVDTELLYRYRGCFLGHPHVAVFYLAEPIVNPDDAGSIVEDLPGFVYLKQVFEVYNLSGALTPTPAFWRREALLDVTRAAVEITPPNADNGWGGFYYWELLARHVLWEEGWDIIVPAIDNRAGRAILYGNTIGQGLGWRAPAFRIVKKLKEMGLEYTLTPERGKARWLPGFQSPVNRWRLNPRPGWKRKKRVERTLKNDTQLLHAV